MALVVKLRYAMVKCSVESVMHLGGVSQRCQIFQVTFLQDGEHDPQEVKARKVSRQYIAQYRQRLDDCVDEETEKGYSTQHF